MNEQDLRTLLHSAAHGGPPAVLDDAAAADAVVATHRTRRRQRRGVVAVALAVAVVAVAVPALTGEERVPERQVAVPLAPAAPDWPLRGSLAGDAAAVEAVRQLSWQGWPEAPPVADREVLFLGDVAGVRWALVVGPAGGGVSGQWFTGPAGTDPTALAADGAVQSVGGAGALAHTSAGGTALLLADPGTRVETSPGVVVDPDGSVRRDYTEAPTAEGVAVAAVRDPGPYGTGAVYRVLRGDALVTEGALPAPSGATRVFDPPVLVPRDPASAPPVPEAVDHALGSVLAGTGLRAEEVRPELLWSGPLPLGAGDGGSPDAAVLAVTLPGGAVAVSAAWADMAPSGAGSAGSCGVQVHPAGTPPEALAVAAECALPTRGFGREPVLLVYAAPPVTRVEVLDAGGAPVAVLDGSPGAGTVSPAPGRGVLRVERPGAPVTEQAVVPLGDALVDRAGRSAGG